MGQKLGFILTKPVQDSSDFGTRKILIEDEEFRDLSQKEKDCITFLFKTMESTGSDFTEAFRILS